MLGVPCITMRNNTERTITCEIGTNIMVGNWPVKIFAVARMILDGQIKQGQIPEKWDGHTAERIVKPLLSLMNSKVF